jgi:hypothetical protein
MVKVNEERGREEEVRGRRSEETNTRVEGGSSDTHSRRHVRPGLLCHLRGFGMFPFPLFDFPSPLSELTD